MSSESTASAQPVEPIPLDAIPEALEKYVAETRHEREQRRRAEELLRSACEAGWLAAAELWFLRRLTTYGLGALHASAEITGPVLDYDHRNVWTCTLSVPGFRPFGLKCQSSFSTHERPELTLDERAKVLDPANPGRGWNPLPWWATTADGGFHQVRELSEALDFAKIDPPAEVLELEEAPATLLPCECACECADADNNIQVYPMEHSGGLDVQRKSGGVLFGILGRDGRTLATVFIPTCEGLEALACKLGEWCEAEAPDDDDDDDDADDDASELEF